jgi:Flp pilus assembly pilin Flp
VRGGAVLTSPTAYSGEQPLISTLHSAAWRLVLDDDGQDLVEYALLTALVGFAGLAAFGLIRDSMAVAYNNWTDPTTAGSIQYHWEPDPPGS